MGTGPANVPPPEDPGDEPTVETPVVPAQPTQMLPATAGAEPTDPGGTGPTDPDKARQRKLMLILLGVFVAGLAVGGLVYALLRNDDSGGGSGTVTTTSSSSTSSSSSSSSSSSAPTTTTPPTTVAPTTTVPVVVPTTQPSAPRFTKFSVTPNPVTCRVSNPDASSTVPPSNASVTIDWATANATRVDVSVDGPGVYASNVGTKGSLDIPYGCPGPHTFTLTAHGPGGTMTSSANVSSHP